MKYFILILLTFIMDTNCFATNDITKIKETIKSFVYAISHNSIKDSNEFLLLYDEYKQCSINLEGNKMENEFFNNYNEYFLKKVFKGQEKMASKIGTSPSILSFDTLQYTQNYVKSNQVYFLDISILFKSQNRLQPQDSLRTLFKFIILEGKLKLTDQFRTISYLHYTLGKLDKVQSMRHRYFIETYKNNYFKDTLSSCIPYKHNNKWGLVSMSMDTLTKADYDSIYPYRSSYALVVKNKHYNLLGKDYHIVFKEFKRHIKFDNYNYYVLNDNNIYELFSPTMNYGDDGNYVNYGSVIQEPDFNTTVNKEFDVKYSISYESKTNSKGKNEGIHTVIENYTNDTLSIHLGFSYIDPQKEFLFGLKEDTAYVMTIDGQIKFKNNFVCTYESGNVDVFDQKTYLFGIICPYSNVYIEPKYQYIYPIKRDAFFVVITKEGEIGYLDRNGKELF